MVIYIFFQHLNFYDLYGEVLLLEWIAGLGFDLVILCLLQSHFLFFIFPL